MSARSALVLSVALAALVGCRKDANTNHDNGGDPAANGKADPNADVGPKLYELAGPPAEPRRLRPAGGEPIVIPNCYVQFEDRQQVAAEVEGKIEVIGSPLAKRADGRYEWRQSGEEPVVYDPARPHPSIVFHPRDRELHPANPEKWVPFWKIADGSVVAAGQVLCMLDDQVITAKMNGAEKITKASAQMIAAAQKGLDKTRDKMRLYLDKPNLMASMSPGQILDDQIMEARFSENYAQALTTIARAESDFEEYRVMLGKYQIKSRVDGIVRSVVKRPGEIVRPGEKIFEIQSTEKVRLEGNLESEYERRVRHNMVVTVEPAVPSPPVATLEGHRQEVAAVAVTGHAARPLVVSAGLDGFVQVRDPGLGAAKDRADVSHSLPHPVPARAVACTPPGAPAALAVTGANDGRVRIWDLSDPERLPTEPKHLPADFHGSAVTAAAVSPDGKYAATAAGREVFVWDLDAGKRLYALPPEHRDSVTSVSFTPQGTLVTAAKDRTLKVWNLGRDRAAVARTVDHRAGAVDALGVSPDGGRVLFDHSRGRIDLVSVADGRTTGQLSNVGANAAFGALALFAPDVSPPEKPMPYTVVTAGGEGDLKGVLQVWQAPKAGGRAAEVARLITPRRAAVTCAAFSPHRDTPFLVVGTAEGTVHVWTPPSDPARRLEGRVTYVETTDPRYVTVRVEMGNKEYPLRDHTTATVIINPEQGK
jgi:WD40 repeat protein